jgi:hypothetical protein
VEVLEVLGDARVTTLDGLVLEGSPVGTAGMMGTVVGGAGSVRDSQYEEPILDFFLGLLRRCERGAACGGTVELSRGQSHPEAVQHGWLKALCELSQLVHCSQLLQVRVHLHARQHEDLRRFRVD